MMYCCMQAAMLVVRSDCTYSVFPELVNNSTACWEGGTVWKEEEKSQWSEVGGSFVGDGKAMLRVGWGADQIVKGRGKVSVGSGERDKRSQGRLMRMSW